MEENNQYYMPGVSRSVSNIGKWYRFFSIMAIIGAAIMVLLGILVIVSAIIEGNKTQYYGGYGMYGGRSYYYKDTTPMLIMGIVYIVASGFLIPIAVFLGKGASAAKRCVMNNDNEQTVLFLSYTERYWKYNGILTIVAISFYVLSIVMALLSFVIHDIV